MAELLGTGAVAVRVAEALDAGDVVFLAADEARAGEVARALAVARPDASVLFCPGSDALPGESAPPSPANVGQRAAALRRLRAAVQATERRPIALVSTGEAAGRLYPAPARFEAAPPILNVGDPLALDAFAAELESLGYVADERVDEPGEMAVRGAVLDVFPADAGQPYRIEVQDGAIAAIRAYDAVTQLTNGECQRLDLGRVSEPELGDGVPLLDHLPGAGLALDPDADARRRRFLALAADAGRRRPKRAIRDVCDEARWRAAADERQMLDLAAGFGEPPPRFVEGRAPARAFAKAVRAARDEGLTVALLGSARDLRFLARRAEKTLGAAPEEAADWPAVRAAGPGALVTLAMPVARGFRLGDVLAVAAADLLGSLAQRDGDDDPAAAASQLFDMGEIGLGDLVVHEDHGLAVVAGIEALPEGDAIVLRFAGDTRRLVPVAEADRLWRYGADEEAVTLDRLDGSSWAKRRGDIDAAVAETARALTRLADERATRTAPVIEPDPARYERFASGFPFTETADQARAIAAVRADLAAGTPMDRLVIGDVGYGKTEVALRAAALAALAGHQVALAAPTTVLARQHYETFGERFDGTGLEVAMLSRLSSPAEKKAVKAGLADGRIAVVIGTGAVAGKGVAYNNLALVIVDEEQRFGAADKSKLRALGAGHVLTLSATPIPRTLQQALIGLQQLSVLATPPARRQPIRTSVAAFDPATVRTALLREKSRGGQSFVVVPRIEDMDGMAARLAELAPELELVQAHGKLPAAEIDAAMVGFARGDGDVLLATNIIEAGLDVPRANTMLVWRADRFGLAQLHQLRGRVGRGSRRGQVLLLTEAGVEIAPRTRQRLATLAAFDRLGAGFAISARDLDMRGAGDLLGDEQAGHVKLIGVDLYQHLLEAALRTARGETVERWMPELNLGIDGRLPPEWIPEEELRIALYARLARIADLGALDAFEEELADRFGELPAEAARLIATARLRALARAAGIARIDAGPAAIALTPRPGAVIDAKALGLTEKQGRLLLPGEFEDAEIRLARTEALLLEIG
jgi:transcription-repair coupling factor (superfamily II helicase)